MDAGNYWHRTLIFQVVNLWLDGALKVTAIDHEVIVDLTKHFEQQRIVQKVTALYVLHLIENPLGFNYFHCYIDGESRCQFNHSKGIKQFRVWNFAEILNVIVVTVRLQRLQNELDVAFLEDHSLM